VVVPLWDLVPFLLDLEVAALGLEVVAELVLDVVAALGLVVAVLDLVVVLAPVLDLQQVQGLQVAAAAAAATVLEAYLAAWGRICSLKLKSRLHQRISAQPTHCSKGFMRHFRN